MVTMKNQLKFIIIIFGLFFSQSGYSQIASDSLGCIPLLVKFTSPNQGLANPIWDFGDGATSDKLNPNHVYTTIGTFNITLKSNNTTIVQSRVRVLNEIIPRIEVDTNQGCAPLTLAFKDKSTIPNGINVESYLWDFGDNDASGQKNPSHTYQDIGKYDVTLSLKTNIERCNITKTFEDFITINQKQNVGFRIDSISPNCVFPTKVYLTYTGTVSNTWTYRWDFGNGQTYNLSNPPPIQYDSVGNYNITLEADNNIGCKSKITKVANLFFDVNFNLDYKPIICKDDTFVITNNGSDAKYKWDFGPTATPRYSDLRKPPPITFSTVGWQSFTLRQEKGDGCSRDTTYKVLVEYPESNFEIIPSIACDLPQKITCIASDTTFAKYFWNTEEGGLMYMINTVDVERDSFYYHLPDTGRVVLTVQTNAGCYAGKQKFYFIKKPNAQFTVNAFEGEVPFVLMVSDSSKSIYPIVQWIFTWGDGTFDVYDSTNIHEAAHMYEVEGRYYVNLSIVNSAGCRDDYYGAWIETHLPLNFNNQNPVCMCNRGVEVNFCINEPVIFQISKFPVNVDAFHIGFDLLSHCESNSYAYHTFREDPGDHPISMTFDNGGVFYDFEGPTLTVMGAKAIIDYKTDCVDKYNVKFYSKSINANSLRWIIDGKNFDQDSFSYRFTGRGDYPIMLIAQNTDTRCDPDTASAMIRLRNVEAGISNVYDWCADQPNLLFSRASKDELVSCGMGYVWTFDKNITKPTVVTDKDSIYTALPVGKHKIRLEVRDVNGCRDTAYTEVFSHGVKADFTADRDAFCKPVNINFKSTSTSDFRIVDYIWNIQPNINQPSISHTFNLTGIDSTLLKNDSIKISLGIKDSLGCTTDVFKKFAFYKPESEIEFNPLVCEKNPVYLTATDYTLHGSSLDYEWKIDGNKVSTANSFGLSNLTPGPHLGKLNIVEKSTGCNNSYDFNFRVLFTPKAKISGVQDTQYCFPKTLQMIGSGSTIDPFDQVGYTWNFGNGRFSTKVNPVETFKKGPQTVTLNIRSVFGCTDSDTIKFRLVGPEGQLTADKDKICQGDKINFKLINAVDVSSFFWDFGQGETSTNINPAAYTYNFLPASGKTFASIVLSSKETGCETVLTAPVEITTNEAKFVTDTICGNDTMRLLNISKGADQFTWLYDGKVISTTESPDVFFDKSGFYTIKLAISNAVGCKDTFAGVIGFVEEPTINVASNFSICGGKPLELPLNPAYIYDISPPGVATIKDGKLIVDTNADKVINLSITDNFDCSTDKFININHVEYNTSDNNFIISSCDPAKSIPIDFGLSANDSIVWTLDGVNVPNGYLSCKDCPNPQILKEFYGDLVGTIYNNGLCTQRNQIFTVEKTDIQIPNVFSPNDDGSNDLFRPVSLLPIKGELDIQDLRVFNRWGKEVYRDTKEWDGKVNGEPAAAEVYYFSMTYVIGKYCTRTVKGDFTLVR